MQDSKKNSYRIRPFATSRYSDKEIAAIHLSVRKWQESNQSNFFSDINDSQEDLNAIEANYIEKGGNFFIAEDITTNQIVGFVGLQNKGNNAGRIKRLAVIPQYQRRGIATALVEAVVTWAKKNGFLKLTLSTGLKEYAKPIYEKFNFHVRKIADNKDYLMEADLSS